MKKIVMQEISHLLINHDLFKSLGWNRTAKYYYPVEMLVTSGKSRINLIRRYSHAKQMTGFA